MTYKTIMIAGSLFAIERSACLDDRSGYIVRDLETHERMFIDNETLTDSQH